METNIESQMAMTGSHNKNTTVSNTYRGLSINTNAEKGLACMTDILDKYHDVLHHMLDTCSDVMQVRFDLHYPADGSVLPSNAHVHRFNFYLKRSLLRESQRNNQTCDPQLIWVREQHISQHPHYHHTALLNANTHPHYYPVVQRAEKIWKQAIGSEQSGLVDFCNKQGENGLIIHRDAENMQEQKDACSYQASYQAKERHKETKEKGTWTVGSNHLPSISQCPSHQ
jgi:hypothetical protein